jgi:hypothetical protein
VAKTQSLLKTAVDARIPLIAAKTDDPRYFPAIVSAITKRKPEIVRWKAPSSIAGKSQQVSIASFMNGKQFGVMEWQDGLNWHDIGVWLEKNEAVLVVMNPETLHPWMMDVGTVTMPPSVIEEFVSEFVPEDENTTMHIAALSGLSYTNMVRITKMAMQRYGEFTPKAIRTIRREFFQVTRGLEEIETEQLFYYASDHLKKWLTVEGALFKPDTHPLLTPRGFLFKGRPGTGKTSGAKFLASSLKVPLYKLDMGMVLSKWVGQSDERLKMALQQADSFEPCVLLIDEVEKLFEMADTSGVMPRLLGYLLWWLQEHQSKVLVIMTTNDEKKIPPELYRPGRLDEVVEFIGLLQTQLLSFVYELGKELSGIAKLAEIELMTVASYLKPDSEGKTFTQARVTEAVLREIKLKVLKHNQEKSSG